VLLLPALRRMGSHIRFTAPLAPAAGGIWPVPPEKVYALGRQVLGEKDDEIGRREELEILFEVLSVGGVEEDFSVEALEAHFAKRDRRTRQVFDEALSRL